jgi:hypothetical protein
MVRSFFFLKQMKAHVSFFLLKTNVFYMLWKSRAEIIAKIEVCSSSDALHTYNADAVRECALRSVSMDFDMNLNSVDSALHCTPRVRTREFKTKTFNTILLLVSERIILSSLFFLQQKMDEELDQSPLLYINISRWDSNWFCFLFLFSLLCFF